MQDRSKHFGNSDRYKNYQKATKDLDQDVAWEALVGDSGRRGQSFGLSDMKRYNALMKAKEQQKKPKEAQPQEPQTPQKPVNQTIGSTGKPKNPIDASTTGEADSTPSNEQTQNVNQDNDINTTVNGNDNTVITEQDHSIRQYGGDNRSFTYNAGKGGNRYEDTPVSSATMGGFYDVNDSPAAQAGRYDLWSTLNSDSQKRYAGDAMKTFAKYGNFDARSYTDESMENTLNRGVQYSFDRADRQTGHVFGDIWNDNYITEDWKMPSAPEPITSNAADIADKAKKDIEDI